MTFPNGGERDEMHPNRQVGRDRFPVTPLMLTLADGARVTSGNRAFNYYDMKPGTVGKIDSRAQPDTMKDYGKDGGPGSEPDTWTNHWAVHHADDGSGGTDLDGSRMISEETARRRYPAHYKD